MFSQKISFYQSSKSFLVKIYNFINRQNNFYKKLSFLVKNKMTMNKNLSF